MSVGTFLTLGMCVRVRGCVSCVVEWWSASEGGGIVSVSAAAAVRLK